MALNEDTQTLVALFFSLDKAQRTAFLREVSIRMAERWGAEPASEPLNLSPNAPKPSPEARATPLPADNLPVLAKPSSAFADNNSFKKKQTTHKNAAYADKFKARADKEIAALTPPTSFRPLGRLEDIDDVPTKRRVLIVAQALRAGALRSPFRAPDIVKLKEPYLKSLWAANRTVDALIKLGVLGYRKLSPKCSNAKVLWPNPKWK